MENNHIDFKGKGISFAYPSSPLAVKEGFGSTGCYSVDLYRSIDSVFGEMSVAIFQHKGDAIAHADSLPQQYTKSHLKFFNK